MQAENAIKRIFYLITKVTLLSQESAEALLWGETYPTCSQERKGETSYAEVYFCVNLLVLV